MINNSTNCFYSPEQNRVVKANNAICKKSQRRKNLSFNPNNDIEVQELNEELEQVDADMQTQFFKL